MSNEERNNAYINSLIGALPQHKAPDTVWQKIESDLWAEEELKSLKQELPVHACPETAWDKLSGSLQRQHQRKLQRTVFSIAASFLLLASAAMFLYNNQPTKEYMISEYEENTTEAAELEVGLRLAEETEAITMIQEFCQNMQTECESNEVQDLLNELTKLNEEYSQLNSLYPSYIDDKEYPELTKIKLKLENTRDEVLKKLINVISA